MAIFFPPLLSNVGGIPFAPPMAVAVAVIIFKIVNSKL